MTDYNQDNQYSDRWNASPNDSSYHNQPTHKPYGQSFTTASNICGVLSLATCQIPFLAIPLAAMGLFFASLVYRKHKPVVASDGSLIRKKGRRPMGFLLSLTALIISCAITVYVIVNLPELIQEVMQDEALMQQLDALTQSLYDMDFAEMWNQLQGTAPGVTPEVPAGTVPGGNYL